MLAWIHKRLKQKIDLCAISSTSFPRYCFLGSASHLYLGCESINTAFVPCTVLQGWKAFFEEPIMLIAFVLLGRNLEQRAKIKATSDLTSLLSILPSKARLLVSNAEDTSSTVEVPCSSLKVGDKIVVLPGVSVTTFST